MKVAVMTGIGKIEFESRPIPTPSHGEVLVKIEYVGICGSDLHYYSTGRIGNFIVEPPFVLGHEASGTVVALGDETCGLHLGDRVALEPGIACGQCDFCLSGRYNLCPDMRFFATPPIDGVFQEYVSHPASLCFKLPENVSALEGALIEPLAVGFHAAATGGAQKGQTALVFGSGCIGLVNILALQANGVEDIYVTDFIDSRLKIAKSLGATDVVNGRNTDVEAVFRELVPQGFDLIIETSGNEVAAQHAIHLAKKGSTLVLVGYSPSGNMNLPIGNALDKELTIKTIFRYRHVYPEAILAVSEGRVNPKKIVTNIFDFDEIPDAMRRNVAEKESIVKAVIKV
jgi:L-iditol 2-dehydrogenase